MAEPVPPWIWIPTPGTFWAEASSTTRTTRPRSWSSAPSGRASPTSTCAPSGGGAPGGGEKPPEGEGEPHLHLRAERRGTAGGEEEPAGGDVGHHRPLHELAEAQLRLEVRREARRHPGVGGARERELERQEGRVINQDGRLVVAV